MKDFIGNNPALFYSFVIGLASAVIAVIVEAGVTLSVGLEAAIMALIVMVASIVIGIITRGKVVPFKNTVEYRQIGPDGKLTDAIVAGPANTLAAPGSSIRPYEIDTLSEPRHERH